MINCNFVVLSKQYNTVSGAQGAALVNIKVLNPLDEAQPCDTPFFFSRLCILMQETVDQRRIQREISILRRLSHGSIIQLLEIVETEHYIFLVSQALHISHYTSDITHQSLHTSYYTPVTTH